MPVFLEPGENLTHMVASTNFRPLVAVIQGRFWLNFRAVATVNDG